MSARLGLATLKLDSEIKLKDALEIPETMQLELSPPIL